MLTFSANGDHANSIILSDPQVDAPDEHVTLSVNHGSLTLGITQGLTFIDGANGAPSLTVQGRLPDLNRALEGMTYLPSAGFAGAETLTISFSGKGIARHLQDQYRDHRKRLVARLSLRRLATRDAVWHHVAPAGPRLAFGENGLGQSSHSECGSDGGRFERRKRVQRGLAGPMEYISVDGRLRQQESWHCPVRSAELCADRDHTQSGRQVSASLGWQCVAEIDARRKVDH